MDGPLHGAFVHVETALIARFGVFPAAFLGKHPLPGPFRRCVDVFPIEGVWEGDASEAVVFVFFIDEADSGEMFLKRGFEGLGKHRHPVFGSLAVADEDLVAREVDVLDAEGEAFHEPESGSVHESGGEALVVLEKGDN